MREPKKLKINIWKPFLIFLVLAMLLTNVAAASADKKEDKNIDESKYVKEEIVGLTDDGKDLLVKRVTIHPKESNSKSKVISIGGSGCYKLMGIKWKTFPVNYVINPSNPQGLTIENITSAISTSVITWDLATSKSLFGTYTTDPGALYGVYDNRNSLVFGNNVLNDNSGVIAQTTTWYTFYGRQIIEFDMTFETDFTWGDATIDATKMDLQNIATHELGHGIGLADLYNSCVDETMYGYSGYGETKKRDLNAGDIAGLQRMYGS